MCEQAYYLQYCEDMRKAVTMPIMPTGGFRSRECMERALRDKVHVILKDVFVFAA